MSEPKDSLRKIPFSKIIRVDSDNESRTKRDPAKLQELVESIRKRGILHNIGVGPANENGEHFVQFGFGRHYATELLLEELAKEGTEESFRLLGGDPEHPEDDRTMIPCRVLTLAEAADVLEIQLIENLQREGVDPVDEARGYAKLLDKKTASGEKVYTMESLAAALGVPKKGPDYIRLRLKLLDAPEALLEAVRQPEGPAIRVAELIGKMMPGKNKELAAARALKDKYTGRPMTVKSVIEMIAADYQKTLRGCDFDTEAVDLLSDEDKRAFGFTGAAGEENDGSCKNCPLRSGNDKTLSGLLMSFDNSSASSSADGVDPLICQHVPCFERKQRAAFRAMEANAEASGYRVMHKERAKALFPYGATLSTYANGDKEFIQQDAKLDFSVTGHMSEETMPTWGDLLKDTKVSWILVKTPGGKRVYILERDTAIGMVDATPACWALTGGKNPLANRPKPKKSATAATPSKVTEGDLTKPLPKAAKAAGGGTRDYAAEQAECRRIEEESEKVNRLVQELVGDGLRSGSRPSVETMVAIIAEVRENAGDDELLGNYLGLWVERPKIDYLATRRALEEKIAEVVQTYEDGLRLLLLIVAFGQYNSEGGHHAPLVKMLAQDMGVDLVACRLKALGEVEGTEAGGTEAPSGDGIGAAAGSFLEDNDDDSGDSEASEKLHTCPDCQRQNFTAKGLKAHKCRPAGPGEPGTREDLCVYHCDVCHALVRVAADEVNSVEAKDEGEFFCANCVADGFPLLPSGLANEYEAWPVVKPKQVVKKKAAKKK